MDRAVAELPAGDQVKDKLERLKAFRQSTLSEEQQIAIKRDAARAKATVQILLAIGAITGTYIAGVVGGLFGRRIVYFSLSALSLGTCVVLFRFMDEYNLVFLFVIFLAGGITAAFYGLLPLYLPELFPTRVRATGQGLSFNFGRFLAAGATLITGDLVKVWGGNYALAGATITLIYIFGMFVIWFGPETKGKPLPD